MLLVSYWQKQKHKHWKIFFTKSLHVTLKKNTLNDLLRAAALISFSLLQELIQERQLFKSSAYFNYG